MPDLSFADALLKQTAEVEMPTAQTIAYGDNARASPQADRILYHAAHVVSQNNTGTSSYWDNSNDYVAVLYRAVMDMQLPAARRPSIAQYSDDTKGAVFGVTACAALGPYSRGGGPKVKFVLSKIVETLALEHPSFCFSSVQINVGLRAKIHVDSGNIGPSCFLELGPFVGGGLWQAGDDGPTILNGREWRTCDGRKPHCTLPYIGSRVSIIAFTHKCLPRILGDHALVRHLECVNNLEFPIPDVEFINNNASAKIDSTSAVMAGTDQYTEMCEAIVEAAS